MLYINERTGAIINVRTPVHGGGWRPMRAAPAAHDQGTAPLDTAPDNVAQDAENGPQGEAAPGSAADMTNEAGASGTAPAVPGPKKPAPKRPTPKRPAAKRSTTSSRKKK